MELKPNRMKAMGAAAWDAGDKPAQEGPDIDQEQPFAPLSLRFIGNPWGVDDHLGGCAVGEGVVRAIARAPPAELASSPHFAAYRAGENGTLSHRREVGNDRPGAEAAIRIKHINPHFEVRGTLEQALHNGQRFVSRSDEGDRQGQTHLPIG